MSDSIEIRRLLKDFLGSEKYQKFVAKLPRNHVGKRLLFWQEDAWQRFEASHPDFKLSFPELVTVFRICELHACELQQKSIPVFRGCIDYAPSFWEDRQQYFPNAPLPFMSTEGREIDDTEVLVWYCPECQAVENARNSF